MESPEHQGPAGARVVTFTANPSIDRTVVLPAPLSRGELQRASSVTEQAAGKGVNVARVVVAAGIPAIAVAGAVDPAYRELVASDAVAPVVRGVPLGAGARVRVNTTITEPDGTTTKINESGPQLTADQLGEARDLLIDAARGAAWVVIAGSLVPGAPDDWYAQLATDCRAVGCKVAVDSSGPALDALLEALPQASFDLIKPNSDELAQLTGGDAAAFERDAAHGELTAIVAAARSLHQRGIANVLVTLGGSGALLVNAEGAWWAQAPRITVRSTVGAGDSSVAGFILADLAGASSPDRLVSAVRHGSAAASLPGTTLPTPSDLPDAAVDVRAI